MKVKILPSAPAGTAAAPPSKSEIHRFLLAAALAKGESVIENASLSEDIEATVRCVEALGAACEYTPGRITVHSPGPAGLRAADVLDCGECGTTLRFLIPVCMLLPGGATLTGVPRLLRRPLGVYERLSASAGVPFENGGATVRVGEGLKSGRFVFPGNVSSQFVSGLLFALPLPEGDSEIVLTGGVESRPYIDLTLDALARFGVAARWAGENTVFVPGGQKYLPCRTAAGGDWSNAAFLIALGGEDRRVTVTGLDPASRQGDRRCTEFFEALSRGPAEICISDQPDLGPVLFAYAALRRGGVFTGTARLRLKESDRCAAMAEELLKFGCRLTVEENRVTVPATALHAPAVPLDGHGDHRVVMSLALLCARFGGEIEGAGAVNKSYPGFFETLRTLGVNITVETG